MRCKYALLVVVLTACQAAGAAEPPLPAWDWNARLRHEHVDDAAFARDADALSVRLRAGLQWQLADRVDARVEAEAVAIDDRRSNSGANGRTGFPSIGDADTVELNQAWVRWRAAQGSIAAGRQRVALDNQRWVGSSSWRQNEQTFDALAASWSPFGALTLQYAWLARAHRTAGDNALDALARERNLDTHLVHGAWSSGAQRLAGFAYLHEDRDLQQASTRTWGARYTLTPKRGERRVGLTVEAARQRDHAANPQRFAHTYWLVEPAVAVGSVTARAGWEHLGGDGRHALQTPLATLHAFNGWADRFAATPAGGLDDRYMGLSGTAPAARAFAAPEWAITWHRMRSDEGGIRYGDELDASIAMPLGRDWRGLAKLTHYRADAFGHDASKVWLQLEWSGRRAP